jgi:hypothetical protein
VHFDDVAGDESGSEGAQKHVAEKERHRMPIPAQFNAIQTLCRNHIKAVTLMVLSRTIDERRKHQFIKRIRDFGQFWILISMQNISMVLEKPMSK